jgi:curved DNA-binding protein CbpA
MDFYKILNVSRHCSQGDIKSAFRKLAMELHPDITQNDPFKAAKFRDVVKAYETLRDISLRREYDGKIFVQQREYRSSSSSSSSSNVSEVSFAAYAAKIRELKYRVTVTKYASSIPMGANMQPDSSSEGSSRYYPNRSWTTSRYSVSEQPRSPNSAHSTSPSHPASKTEEVHTHQEGYYHHREYFARRNERERRKKMQLESENVKENEETLKRKRGEESTQNLYARRNERIKKEQEGNAHHGFCAIQ